MYDLPDDYEVEGQMSIYDMFEQPVTPLIAVSKVFARTIKQMSLPEWKTFVMALTRIKWTEKNKNIVYLDKKELAKVLGIQTDSEHLNQHLRQQIGKLAKHSFIEFTEKDGADGWDSGMFITKATCNKNVRGYVRIKFEEEYLPLFQELDKERNYITLWADDLFGMKSERSILFYEELRLHSDTRQECTRIFRTKELKELFNIPKDGKGSYMRKDGHFDRRAFENRVIDPLCEDLKKCRMINLTVNEDGKYYRKIKNHGYVVGYEFAWNVSTHPAVATAAEVKNVKDEIDKNPEVLKIAKNILENKKKTKKNNFNSFNQREYDYDELERRMLERSRRD